jgi:predicted esterase
MRRLVLVLAVFGLALLGASSAGAAPSNTIVVRAAGHAPIRVLLRVEGRTQVLGRALGRGAKKPQKVTVSLRIPKHLPEGRWPVIVCVSHSCRRVSWVDGDRSGAHLVPPLPETPTAARSTTPSAAAAPAPAELGDDIAPQPISTVPADPIPHPVAEPFFHAGGGAEYAAFIPRSYDATNQTPTTLFVWLHGCGGEAEGDAWVVDPGAEEGVPQGWMTLSLGGRDGGCWNPLAETEPLVMAAIADFETHFNVNRGRLILGGYSSGGDLAYRTAFKHSSTFAGLLIENSAPFRDTEASEAELLGAATTKFPIVHLAHAEDKTYELDEVEPEIAAVRAAGFPVEFIVRPGGHSDTHTNADLLAYLLPHIDDFRLAP